MPRRPAACRELVRQVARDGLAAADDRQPSLSGPLVVDKQLPRRRRRLDDVGGRQQRSELNRVERRLARHDYEPPAVEEREIEVRDGEVERSRSQVCEASDPLRFLAARSYA